MSKKKKARNANGIGSVYKRSDGMWVGAICIPGEDGKLRRKTVSSKDRNTVLEKFRKLRTDIDEGRVVMTPSTTVGAWLGHWLDNVIKPHRTPTTHRSYEQCARLYIKPAIGAKRLDKLTPDQIRDMEKLAQQKSPRFAQLAHNVLSAALNQAVKDGRLGKNPVAAVTPPKYVPKQQTVFDRETATRLLKTANTRGLREGTLWAVAFSTGTRRSELIGIEWDRVDLDKGELDLSWQLQAMKKGWTPPEGLRLANATAGCGGPTMGLLCAEGWLRPLSPSGVKQASRFAA